MVRTIFAQPGLESVWAQHRRVVDHLTELGLTPAADHLDEAGAEILAFAGFPKANWRQIWSNKPPRTAQQRNTAPYQRRGHLHTRASIIRLVGTLLAEQHDEWTISRRYMSLDSLNQTRIRLLEPESVQPTEEVAHRTQISQNRNQRRRRRGTPLLYHIPGRDPLCWRPRLHLTT